VGKWPFIGLYRELKLCILVSGHSLCLLYTGGSLKKFGVCICIHTHTDTYIYIYIHTTRARCNFGSDRNPFYFTSAREWIAASKFFRSIHSLLQKLAKSDPFLFDISERPDRSLQSIRWSTTFDYTLAHFGHVRLSCSHHHALTVRL